MAYNVTVDLDFNKWTGITTFSLQALNRSTSEVVVTSDAVEIILVGMSFFKVNDDGAADLLGGPNYPLVVGTEQVERDEENVNLGVFIQYIDGTNSNDTITVDLDGVVVGGDFGGILQQDGGCASVAPFEAGDVILAEGCGVGFAVLEEGGVSLGLDVEKYTNGTAVVEFEWGDIVAGSDLEEEGYGMFLEVSIEGEVVPVVWSIVPGGTFGTGGGERVVLEVANLPGSVQGIEEWVYLLEIEFAEETREAEYVVGTAVVYGNGSAGLTFALPAGVGLDLEWSLNVTKPTGEVLQAADGTGPPYLFSFGDDLAITSIEPAFGPEEGGTTVVLIGTFPNVDAGEFSITFDGMAIDAALVGEVSSTNITFVTPPMATIGSDFNVAVVVTIGESTSNEVIFTYVASLILESMSPTTGPVEGGTQVTLTGQFTGFDPASGDSGIFFDDMRIDPELVTFSNASQIVFNTPPQTSVGADSEFSYGVSVQVSGASSNTLEFVYESPLVITSISPSSGDENGGTEVTLTGTFASFDPSTSVVHFGVLQIPSSEVEYNDTAIIFTTPPLSDVGSSYTQSVFVTIGQIASNEVEFTYEDTGSTVSITGSGGVFDSESGFYQVGVCSNSLYRAAISNGARFQNAVYEWTMTAAGSTTNILSSIGIVATSEVLFIPYNAFPEKDVPYTLTITVETSFSSFQQTMTVVQLSVQRIGVFINDPQVRSISDPNVTLTVPADLFIPGCSESSLVINSTEITYEWTFRGETHVFSYTNTSAPEEEISPTLLGREFHIPQSLMEYGRFGLSLTAYLTEERSVRGSDGTIVVISPAPLRPQINGGEYSRFVSETEGLLVSAERSNDPDVLVGDDTADLSYAWSCRYAWDESMRDALICDDGLMPPSALSSVEFTVDSSSLAAVQNTSAVFIEYTLQISKTSLNATGDELLRVSDSVAATFILSEEQEQEFEALVDVLVTNNQTVPVDPSQVKYYEDITITPISETTATTWTYEVIAPAGQARTLLASDSNLLTLPGYFTSSSGAGRLSLGFKSNILDPATEYRILISTFHPDFAINENVISITTVEQPKVILGSLATPVGSTTDTYALSAYTSYAGDFKFFFILTDEFGVETCVGGCQGENVVKFRLATAGSYIVRCDVYDWIGFTLLGTATGSNITVSNSAATQTDLADLYDEAYGAFQAGDHATYQQLGWDMVKLIWSLGGSTAVDLDSAVLANFTQGMNQVAANAVPNAIQSAGYVSTAAALASLTPSLGITYDTETLYYMVNITVSAIERVPDNGALQVIEELLQFYDLTPALVLASYQQGTTRRRLLRQATDTESEVIDIWLDLYEVMKEQIAVSLLKRCTCGCVEEVTTGIRSPSSIPFSGRDRIPTEARQSAAASYENPNQGRISQVTIKAGHFCNSEQGSQLSVNDGAEGEVQFSWCKDLFEDSIKRLYFSVAVTPDYIYLSRLHQNTTLTDGLISTMVATLDGNEVQDAGLAVKDCYRVRMPLLRNLTVTSNETPEEEVPMGLLFAPVKEWGQNNSTALYEPDFSSISTSFSDSSVTADTEFTTATLTTSATGVFTIGTRLAWASATFSFEGLLLLAAEIAGVTVLVFVLVLMSISGAWFIATRLFATTGMIAPVEADFTYVERDIYGRGTVLDMMNAQDAQQRPDAGNQ